MFDALCVIMFSALAVLCIILAARARDRLEFHGNVIAALACVAIISIVDNRIRAREAAEEISRKIAVIPEVVEMAAEYRKAIEAGEAKP